jgi:hypothetical protein
MVKGYMVGESLGERDESTSFQNKYNVFHPVDRSEVPPDAKIPLP